MLYLLNKNVDYLKLKHGEIVLINKKTGYWVKTSISFFPIYTLLKKGIEKNELENYLESKYKEKKEEIIKVIEMIEDNGLLEFSNFKSEIVDLENSNFINIISLHPFNLKLKNFIRNYFQGKNVYVVLEEKTREWQSSLRELEIINNEINLYSSFRIDFESLDKEISKILSDSHFDEIQLVLKEFFVERAKERLKLIEYLKSNKKLNLRINLLQYCRAKKKESVALPVDVIEPHAYTFTFDDVLESKSEIYHKIKDFFKLWEIFHTEIRIPKKSHIKPQIDNLFSFIVIFPIKRVACGAGVINFFIDEAGHVYPCKYMKNFKIGDLDNGFGKIKSSVKKRCENCNFLNFCGGIGYCIPEIEFDKICQYMRKMFKKFIESFSIDLLKRLEEFYSNRQHYEIPEDEIKEQRTKLIRRFTCLPGVY